MVIEPGGRVSAPISPPEQAAIQPAWALLFARLDEKERASLWLFEPPSQRTTKIADLDAGPAGDYYGWLEWSRVFAYSPR